MTITCDWKCVVGKLVYEPTGDELILYGGGNVFACICRDSFDESGETYHALWDFICDWKHLKRILENDPYHYTDYTNIRLNTKYNDIWQIAKTLARFGHRVTICTDEEINLPF